MLTKHEFKNIVQESERQAQEYLKYKGVEYSPLVYEDWLVKMDYLYDALWEHLKDCD